MSNITSVPCDEDAIRSGAPPPVSVRGGLWILVATILGSSMVFIDSTVVNVALPALQRALNATGAEVQWVVEAYALFLAALLLVGGSLGDLYGRRRIFLIGTLLFATASVWCGLAPNIHGLIAARGLQGIGGALLVPGSLALISSSFCAEDRGRAIGTWSGFTSITASIGPVLGGWLIQHGSWRWVFFINVPLAVIVVAISVWSVPESKRENGSQRLDWFGAALITLGLGGITFALIEARRGGAAVVAAAVCGVVAFITFVLVEWRSDSPMLPFQLFRSRSFSGANLLTLFLYAAFGGVLFFLPMDLIQVQGYSPTQAGGAFLPLIVLIFLLSRWSGGLVVRYGAKLPLVVGPTIAAVGFGLFTRAGIGGSYAATILPAVLVLGMGMAVSVAPLTTTVMSSIEQSRAGVASGINNAVSRVGGLLAVAVLGLVFSTVFGVRLDRGLDALALPVTERAQVDGQRAKLGGIATDNLQVKRAIARSFVDAYTVVLWTAVGLSLASAVSAAILIESEPGPESGATG